MNNYHGKRAAVLLSRQPMRPDGNIGWVRNCLEALNWAKSNGLILRSSVGMPTWDFLTALAGNLGVPIDLVVRGDNAESLDNVRGVNLGDFELERSIVRISSLSMSTDDHPHLLDHAVVDKADLLLPVSIRPGGKMEEILKETGRQVIRQFEIPYSFRVTPIHYHIDPDNLSSQLMKFELSGETFLIHWTRSYSGKWPDETTAQYVRDIVNSSAYPRTAFATLRRILTTRCLLASGRHMPRNEPTVSFTALKPSETVPLMRWRARYREMSFEPYGIGVKLETALRLGVRRVVYDHEAGMAEDLFWTVQSPGRKSDWRKEKEYRIRGIFDFASIPDRDLTAFCRFSGEAAKIEAATGIRTIPVEKG